MHPRGAKRGRLDLSGGLSSATLCPTKLARASRRRRRRSRASSTASSRRSPSRRRASARSGAPISAGPLRRRRAPPPRVRQIRSSASRADPHSRRRSRAAADRLAAIRQSAHAVQALEAKVRGALARGRGRGEESHQMRSKSGAAPCSVTAPAQQDTLLKRAEGNSRESIDELATCVQAQGTQAQRPSAGIPYRAPGILMGSDE